MWRFNNRGAQRGMGGIFAWLGGWWLGADG
jgi:hypothetical protein